MSDDDQPCTDCRGTGVTIQTERRCACQPPEPPSQPPMTPSPEDVERMIERLRKTLQRYNGRGTFRDELVNPDGPAAADMLAALSAIGGDK